MTEKEVIIKARQEMDDRLARAKETGNLIVPNAVEDEKVIRHFLNMAACLSRDTENLAFMMGVPQACAFRTAELR